MNTCHWSNYPRRKSSDKRMSHWTANLQIVNNGPCIGRKWGYNRTIDTIDRVQLSHDRQLLQIVYVFVGGLVYLC